MFIGSGMKNDLRVVISQDSIQLHLIEHITYDLLQLVFAGMRLEVFLDLINAIFPSTKKDEFLRIEL